MSWKKWQFDFGGDVNQTQGSGFSDNLKYARNITSFLLHARWQHQNADDISDEPHFSTATSTTSQITVAADISALWARRGTQYRFLHECVKYRDMSEFEFERCQNMTVFCKSEIRHISNTNRNSTDSDFSRLRHITDEIQLMNAVGSGREANSSQKTGAIIRKIMLTHGHIHYDPGWWVSN